MRAANVGVRRQVGQVTLIVGQRQRELVQPLFQDRGDALVAGRVDRQRPGTGLFKAFTAVAPTETQQSQTSAVAMLWMRAVLELALHHLQRAGADVLGPVEE